MHKHPFTHAKVSELLAEFGNGGGLEVGNRLGSDRLPTGGWKPVAA